MSYFDYNKELEIARTSGDIERVIELITDRKIALLYIPGPDETYYSKHQLYKACKKGDIELVKILLSKRYCGPNNHDSISIALEKGYLDIVEILGYTLNDAFMLMCELDKRELVKTLLERYKIDICYLDNRVIRCATYYGQIELLEILLDYNKSLDLNISGGINGLFGESPLQLVNDGNIAPNKEWSLKWMKELFEKYQEAQT